MNGIIGIIGSPKPGETERMGRCLAHRGKVVLKTGNAFSIGQLSTIPQIAPFCRNGITVVSDARVDNRSEISAMFPASACEPKSVNEFIFTAYSEFGIRFTEFLTGDYSITILDENCKKLFLIRDHMGVRPLYYVFQQGVSMAFASEPKALLLQGTGSPALNPEKLREYLQWPTDFRQYQKTTFYQDIFSVLPATVLEADLNLTALKETFYWKIDPERFLHLTEESVCIAEYRKRFETAVRRRLHPTTGVHVSGGLDSGSVYKTAEKYLSREQLYSIHFYPGTSESDERAYADEIIRGNEKNHFRLLRSDDPLAGIRQAQDFIDRPDPSTVLTGIKILPELNYFKSKGVTSVLTGHEGDTVVDLGASYLLDLVVNLKLAEFEELITGERNSSKAKRMYFMKEALLHRITVKGFISALKFVGILFGQKNISFLDSLRITASCIFRISRKVMSQYGRKFSGHSEAVRYVPETLTVTQREHFSRIYSAGIIEINETLNLSGAAYGIEYAHPFLDKDFIEVSLFMPDKMRLGPGGLTRYHFRKAMTDTLPEKIRIRQSKTRFDKPIWLTLIDTVNACLRENVFEADTKSILLRIKNRLQMIDSQHPNFNKIRKFQRRLLLEIWKNQLGQTRHTRE